MFGRLLATAITVAALGAAACSDTGTPATAPPTSPPTNAAPTTTVALTTMTTLPPTTTTTQPATTTTIDRIAEIEAIITDLELRRLDAVFRRDLEALRSLFASDELYAAEAEAVSSIEWDELPTFELTVRGVEVDEPECLVVAVTLDYSASLGPDVVLERLITFQPVQEAWGFSYRSADDTWWDCEGEHPLADR